MFCVSSEKVSGIRNSIILLCFELLVWKRGRRVLTALDASDCEKTHYELFCFVSAVCMVVFGVMRKLPMGLALLMYSVCMVAVTVATTTIFSKTTRVKFENEDLYLSVMPSGGLRDLHFGSVSFLRATILVMLAKMSSFVPENARFLSDAVFWAYFCFFGAEYLLFFIFKASGGKKVKLPAKTARLNW